MDRVCRAIGALSPAKSTVVPIVIRKIEGRTPLKAEIAVEQEFGCVFAIPVPNPVTLANWAFVVQRIIGLHVPRSAKISISYNKPIGVRLILDCFHPVDMSIFNKVTNYVDPGERELD